MKEAIFILLVICILAALTAVKYRKQISGMIGFARMLREAKPNFPQGANNLRGTPEKSTPLVNCSKCGVWVPQNKARKVDDVFFCSEHA